jgi:hypothetical protein
MNSKLLYLLGAGASCQALPLVMDFPKRLTNFTTYLHNMQMGTINKALNTGNISSEDIKALLDSTKWLTENASKHASIDTFAKKLYFKQDIANLKRLKAVLSTFLVVEQARNNVDKRYDSFLASVLETEPFERIKIPDSIRILTWNYDTQLEKALYDFCEDENLVLKLVTFNRKICRINGYCGTNPEGHVGPEFKAIWSRDKKQAYLMGISLFKSYMQGNSTPDLNIRFSWESITKTILNNRIRELDLSDISIIVIVGYSFPYFNRDIDGYIFSNLTNAKTIYLQYPDGAHAAIEERIDRIKRSEAKIVKVKGVDLFYIPDEF